MDFAITGHQGLIGSSLKKRLEDEGHKCVFSMDLQSGDDVCIDMKNQKCSADIMLHLASNCKINKCISDPRWCFENVIGVFEVLEFCRKNNIKKIVAFSSSRILDEEKNPYTSSKRYTEELCKAYSACYGIEYIIVRPSTVYGPFDDKTNRLMDIWIRDALNNKNLKIYGDPKTKTLDFTFIDDFVDGIILAIDKDKWNKEYNISGGEEYNLERLAEFILRKTNSNGKVIIEPEEMQQPQKVRLNISEIKKIGYSPKINLKEGVRRTIKFYKENNLR